VFSMDAVLALHRKHWAFLHSDYAEIPEAVSSQRKHGSYLGRTLTFVTVSRWENQGRAQQLSAGQPFAYDVRL